MMNLSGKSTTKNPNRDHSHNIITKSKTTNNTEQNIINPWNFNLIIVDYLKRSNYMEKEDKIEVMKTLKSFD